MRKHLFLIILILFLFMNLNATLTPGRIQAQKATLGIDIVPNISFSTEFGLNKKFGIGASLGLFNRNDQLFVPEKNSFFETGESTYIEGHMLYNLVPYSQDVPFDLSLLGGLWGTESKFALQAGVLFDVPLSRQLNARINVIFGPRAGIEIAYKIDKKYEVCFDLGVAVGILGLRIYF